MKSPAKRPGAAARPAFSFIDLFAGIGGLRLGFEAAGGQCVFTSEWDRFARETYRANFDCSGHALAGDITQVPADAIPPHDVLLAGFPCQPFSLAGLGHKNKKGEKHGFADKTQGTLFFDIARIIAHHRPAAFFLENVRNLVHHDKGRTFKTIVDTLQKDLGYHVQYRVINAKGLVPQSRPRVYIMGFREDCGFRFDDFAPKLPSHLPILKDILLPTREIGPELTLSDKMMAWVERQAARNKSKGNGFRTRYLGPKDTIPALIASYGCDREFFIKQRRKNPRRLAARECARAMGFPDSFDIPVSRSQAYRQFGNSVVVPLIAQIARAMIPFIMEIAGKTAYIKRHDRPRPKNRRMSAPAMPVRSHARKGLSSRV
ncbi:MAG: DNA (cytosine-5-)-methyltransferase [Alphaproteobacteria bacterium]|nr:DNA (cytosine-5-)-methyltransferase [Alphaproteobacteria bacterium]